MQHRRDGLRPSTRGIDDLVEQGSSCGITAGLDQAQRRVHRRVHVARDLDEVAKRLGRGAPGGFVDRELEQPAGHPVDDRDLLGADLSGWNGQVLGPVPDVVAARLARVRDAVSVDVEAVPAVGGDRSVPLDRDVDSESSQPASPLQRVAQRVVPDRVVDRGDALLGRELVLQRVVRVAVLDAEVRPSVTDVCPVILPTPAHRLHVGGDLGGLARDFVAWTPAARGQRLRAQWREVLGLRFLPLSDATRGLESSDSQSIDRALLQQVQETLVGELAVEQAIPEVCVQRREPGSFDERLVDDALADLPLGRRVAGHPGLEPLADPEVAVLVQRARDDATRDGFDPLLRVALRELLDRLGHLLLPGKHGLGGDAGGILRQADEHRKQHGLGRHVLGDRAEPRGLSSLRVVGLPRAADGSEREALTDRATEPLRLAAGGELRDRLRRALADFAEHPAE